MEWNAFSLARWLVRGLAIVSLALPCALRAEDELPAPLHAVDELAIASDQDELRGAGWFMSSDPQQRVATVQVEGAGFSARVPIEVVRRPDVAKALSRAEALESGWRFTIATNDVGVLEGPLDLRFLDAEGAVLGEARGLPLIQLARESGANRHWAFALLVSAMLLFGLLVRGFRTSSRTPRALNDTTGSTRRQAALSAGVILACAVVIGAVSPPFQSPDEFDHVERAYGLSQGHVRLATPEGSVSGVWVDDGLLAYMAKFSSLALEPEARLARDKATSSLEIAWADSKTFSGAPGTGYYLPLIYAPQAAALALGEQAGISVDASYRLARLSSGGLAALLLFVAFLRWQPSVLVMALLLTPMTLFQWAGAGIDALSIGATALAIALWLDSAQPGFAPSARRVLAVSLLIVAVVGCRFHLAPLLLIPLLMLRRFGLVGVLMGLLPTLIIGAWVTFALASTQHPSSAEMPVLERLHAYAAEPFRLVEVFWTTATTPAITDFYGRSFIGILGWLDTPLPDAMYAAWGVMLAAATAWTLASADWRSLGAQHAMLIVMALGSALLVPTLLLLMWTSFDAPTIDGVQGRYFLLPALLLAMAIPVARQDGSQWVDRIVSRTFAALVALYGLVALLPLLVARYYG